MLQLLEPPKDTAADEPAAAAWDPVLGRAGAAVVSPSLADYDDDEDEDYFYDDDDDNEDDLDDDFDDDDEDAEDEDDEEDDEL